MVAEAVPAVYGTIILRLEGDLSLLAAISANNGEELALGCAVTLTAALITAVTATNGLIFKALLLVECLLTGGENKIVATIFAFQCFILEFHVTNPLTFFLNHLFKATAASRKETPAEIRGIAPHQTAISTCVPRFGSRLPETNDKSASILSPAESMLIFNTEMPSSCCVVIILRPTLIDAMLIVKSIQPSPLSCCAYKSL